MGNPIMLGKRRRISGSYANLKRTILKKVGNKDRQVTSEPKIIDITKNAMAPSGVIGFFEIKKDGNNPFTFTKSIFYIVVQAQ
ncbi:hypothetical protein BOW52_08210 [Solemya elarraichensis gill symbiont]|uniref:Uncharacterized protein n=1 Tax=Solemya elarraichensis gill symbiont TaxID=1918949 RepID=A0A1T2L0L5_9GAMM|nr:hypothetical protein BOW52_08210 [Solemya elarraichensis gill symbiont]